jgi:ribosomal subunit interface protein|tara:strand:- start:173 stop:889 length:717 start_codon:yes stop_codon:yes gene_type:complete
VVISRCSLNGPRDKGLSWDNFATGQFSASGINQTRGAYAAYGPGLSIEGDEMRYQISGKQIDIGEALQTHVKEELGTAVAKYAERPTDAMVVFSKSASEFACEAIVHLSTGLTAQASAKAHEIYAAFDACCEKMEKQLRRYKRRLKDHHRDRAEPVELFGASTYILAGDSAEPESEPDSLQPIIVAEMETKIPSLSVGEAVMQMELAGAPVLVFRKQGKDTVNVVYRREDGNIGWIDP